MSGMFKDVELKRIPRTILLDIHSQQHSIPANIRQYSSYSHVMQTMGALTTQLLASS